MKYVYYDPLDDYYYSYACAERITEAQIPWTSMCRT